MKMATAGSGLPRRRRRMWPARHWAASKSVGVQVTNVGSDMGSLTPMAEQIQERTGELPKTVLADGGHAKQEDVVSAKQGGGRARVAARERQVTRPAPQRRSGPGSHCLARADGDARSPGGISRTCGPVRVDNAHQKSHHGLTQFLVKGVAKVTSVVLLNAIARTCHNTPCIYCAERSPAVPAAAAPNGGGMLCPTGPHQGPHPTQPAQPSFFLHRHCELATEARACAPFRLTLEHSWRAAINRHLLSTLTGGTCFPESGNRPAGSNRPHAGARTTRLAAGAPGPRLVSLAGSTQ